MKKYLSVGNDTILQSENYEIANSAPLKPVGGLWATEFDEDNPYYNDWIQYVMENREILGFKYHNMINDGITAVCFTLKENANILVVNSLEQIEFFKKKYPYNDNGIDFSKLSEDFDGIFMNVRMISRSNNELSKAIEDLYSVNSLLIFKSNCVESYQDAYVKFDNIDPESMSDEGLIYTIKLDENIKTLNPSRN